MQKRTKEETMKTYLITGFESLIEVVIILQDLDESLFESIQIENNGEDGCRTF
jgi:hypothetical protein